MYCLKKPIYRVGFSGEKNENGTHKSPLERFMCVMLHFYLMGGTFFLKKLNYHRFIDLPN